MNNITSLTLTETMKALEEKQFSLEELNNAYLERIKKYNPELNVYLTVNESSDGIPAAIKDLIVTKGITTTAGSKILENFIPPYNATIVDKLFGQGVSVLGKVNLDEFAMGSSGENSAYGPTKNPWDKTKVPGGSSSGSAAAVAADLATFALGTDTGGSIRQPASLTGVVGLKPSYGRVSRYGAIAMASSLDQIGPITKTVEDAKILFDVIHGKDILDSTSIEKDFYPEHKKTQKIFVPRILIQGVDPEVLRLFDEKIKKLEYQGYEITENIIFEHEMSALAAYYIVNFAEVSTNLSRFDGVRYGLSLKGENLLGDYAKSRGEGFGPETRRRIMLGTYVLSSGYYDAYYAKATAARAQLRKEFEEAFKSVDIIATPTMPYPAWKIGEKSDPLAAYLADIFTVTANLTGNPAISLPMGTVTRDGKELPVGIQFTAAHGDEPSLFVAGKLLQ